MPGSLRRLFSAFLFPTLVGYRRSYFRRDLVAGITAGAVVIPQAMAYATIANLPVEIGLYTCMVPMLVYAALGGSRAMSVSTTSTIATLTATTFASASIAAASEHPERDLVGLTLLVGAILIVARLFKLGTIIENINDATLIGVKIGLGATVALGQVPKLLGIDVEPTGHGFIRSLNATIAAVPQTSLPTLLLSLGSIALLLLLKRFVPRIPGQLIVVALGILLIAIFGSKASGLAVVPRITPGLPLPALPDPGHLVALLPGAFAIAIMSFLESAGVARSIRRTGEPAIDSNRELLAVGTANVLGSFFSTLPAAGGFSQSAVNLRAGARSQLASVVTVALAVLVALVLAPILDNLPQASLAALVFVAVISLIDIPGLLRLFRISRTEFWIAVVTALIGMSAGLLAAILAGVVFTLGLVLHELNRPNIGWHRKGTELIVELRGPLYTASVLPTQRAIEHLLDSDIPTDTLLLGAESIRATSLTVLDAFAEFDRDLDDRGVVLIVRGLRGPALAMAEKTEWWQRLEASGRVRS